MGFTGMPCRVLHPSWAQVQVHPFQWLLVHLQRNCESKFDILVWIRLVSGSHTQAVPIIQIIFQVGFIKMTVQTKTGLESGIKSKQNTFL